MQIKIPVFYKAVVSLEGHRAPFLCNVEEDIPFDVRQIDAESAPVVLRFRPDEPTGSKRMRSVRKAEGEFYARIYEWDAKRGRQDDDEWTLKQFLGLHNLLPFPEDIIRKDNHWNPPIRVGERPFNVPTVKSEEVVQWHDDTERNNAHSKASLVAEAVVQIDGERWYRCHEPKLCFDFRPWTLKPGQDISAKLFEPPAVELDFTNVGGKSRFTKFDENCRLACNDVSTFENHGVHISKKVIDVVAPEEFGFDSRIEAVTRFADAVLPYTIGDDATDGRTKSLRKSLIDAVEIAKDTGTGDANEIFDMTVELKDRFAPLAKIGIDQWLVWKMADFLLETDREMAASPRTTPRAPSP